MDAVFSESLAYGQMKRRSVSARSFRVKIPPTNGTTFSPESTIQVDLPGNLAGQFYDFSSMYLKFKVTNGAVSAAVDRGGAYSFFSRLQITTAGAQICNIANWGTLCTVLLDSSSSSEYRSGFGNILLGTLGDSLRGVEIAAAGTRVFAMPIQANPLAMSSPHRLLPAYSLGAITLQLTLNSAQLAVNAATATTLSFSEVELCCMMTELSPQAMAQLDASVGGKYNILASSFINAQATLEANATQLTSTLGVSVSSLERIICAHRGTASLANVSSFSLGNRTTSGLVSYNYQVNGESIPARIVVVGDQGAESTAEFLVADHSLVDYNKGCGLSNGTVLVNVSGGIVVGALSGIAPNVVKSACFMLKDGLGHTAGIANASMVVAGTASDVGTFLISTDFENGLSVGKSATIYSGISTIASNVQFLGTYASPHLAAQIDWWAQFSVLLSLDMRASGVYSISV
jgi:hypothetical protein